MPSQSGEHLAVQAGTGTGKSLAYLVPAAAHAVHRAATVVVSTATIALQRQLIDRDLPRLADAVAAAARPGPRRSRSSRAAATTCACTGCERRRARGARARCCSTPRAVSAIGRQVQRLHEWAATTKTGDRDELVPGVYDQAWRQVSVTARECIGAQRCPYGPQCFAELAREEAGRADIVVTNHALLAIDAMEDYPLLPEHDVVIIDEAHDLVDRVTSVGAKELSVPAVEFAARRLRQDGRGRPGHRLREAAEAAAQVLPEDPRAGRIDVLTEPLAATLAARAGRRPQLRGRGALDRQEHRRGCRTAGATPGRAGHAGRGRTRRPSGSWARSAPDCATGRDVVWMDRPTGAGVAAGRRPLRVAPLEVGGLLADRLFGRRTVTLTSATLSLGGSFEPLARQWGLPPPGSAEVADPGQPRSARPGRRPAGTGPAGRDQLGRRNRAVAPGPGWTSARRSTTRAAASCTSPSTCRRRAATGLPGST